MMDRNMRIVCICESIHVF